MRSQSAQKRWLIGRIRPIFPFQPGIRYNSATPLFGRRCSSGRACSTTSAERNRSRGQSAHSPIGMSSMKRTSYFPSCASCASAGISSAFTPPSSTALSFVPRKPAFHAASRPASVSASEPPRVSDANLSSFKVSRLIFSRSTPACFSSAAYCGRSAPLVVMVSSRTPLMARRLRHKSTMPRRTSGSPPVSRTLLTPSETAVRTISVSSSNDSISLCSRLHTPSAGIQYRHRKLHRSVTDSRR